VNQLGPETPWVPRQRPSAAWRAAAARGQVHPRELARVFDHTLLKAQATPSEVLELCAEAVRYGFGAVCVNSAHVPAVVRRLRELGTGARAGAAADAGTGAQTGGCPGVGPEVAVAAVVGFPLGAAATEVKACEAAWAIRQGAVELDMVLSVGHLKAGQDDYVEEDIRAVVEAAGKAARERGLAARPLVKVILETCYLSDDEKVRACLLAARAGADFVKTSTGFGSGGATAADVELMRATVGEELGVKASGGIRDLSAARAMLAAGADRLGLSAGVAVITQALAEWESGGGRR